jgi:hypothetical protein
MSRKAAIAVAACIAILMVAGVLWFVFRPEKPVPNRHPVVPPELVGVGIMLRANTQTHEVIVQQVVPNAPAAEAGITNNLIITRVDEVSLADVPLADVANLIRGPVGTEVKLELVTPDHSQIQHRGIDPPEIAIVTLQLETMNAIRFLVARALKRKAETLKLQIGDGRWKLGVGREKAERQPFACLVSFVVKNPCLSVSICG